MKQSTKLEEKVEAEGRSSSFSMAGLDSAAVMNPASLGLNAPQCAVEDKKTEAFLSLEGRSLCGYVKLAVHRCGFADTSQWLGGGCIFYSGGSFSAQLSSASCSTTI